MGHGFGYYDKLLEHARPDAPLVALAFECQLFPEIPTQDHDVFMDKIITEQAIYRPRDAGLAGRTPMNRLQMPAHPRRDVEDTYAEAFRSIYAEVLITARDRTWLDHAVAAATGNASSTILCDCEAGLDRYVGPGGDESFATPDGRPGAVVQFHVPRFRKDRVAGARTLAAGAHQPERADLSDDGLLQPARHRAVFQASADWTRS